MCSTTNEVSTVYSFDNTVLPLISPIIILIEPPSLLIPNQHLLLLLLLLLLLKQSFNRKAHITIYDGFRWGPV